MYQVKDSYIRSISLGQITAQCLIIYNVDLVD